MLVAHSHRWRDVFMTHSIATDALNSAHGRLDALECFEITDRLLLQSGLPTILASAPRLSEFYYHGNAGTLPSLPWGQLTKLGWTTLPDGAANDFLVGLPFLANLSRDAAVSLAGFVGFAQATVVFDGPGAMVTSHICQLTCQVGADTNISRSQTVFINVNDVLRRLILPSLDIFRVHAALVVADLHIWDSDTFFGLAARSNLSESLTVLSVLLVITEDELLDVLRYLRRLEHLILTDLPTLNHTLITDSFFRALEVPTPDSVATGHNILVPRLDLLNITTCLRFSDEVLRKMVESRLAQKDLAYAFTVCLQKMQAAERELETEMDAHFTELDALGQMGYVVMWASESRLNLELGIV